MLSLKIIKAKPNPTGKDRLGRTVPNQQLAGEWVDFKNTDTDSVSLADVELQHVAYPTHQHPNGIWTKVMSFKGDLGSGEIVRVHSGGKIDLDDLFPQDRTGADYHLFTGKNYVWNNDKRDIARLVKTTNSTPNEIDKAEYSANPQEGKILVRSGDQLI